MDITSAIKQISKEVKGARRKDVFDDLEDILVQNIEETSNIEDFFKLPLVNLLSIISKVDFTLISDKMKVLKILQNFVQKSVKAHDEEKETKLLLQNIDITNIPLTFE